MAVLHGSRSQIEMVFSHYRLGEEGQPTWISIHLQLKENGRLIVSTTVSMTKEDLAELRSQLNDLATDRRVNFSLTMTDGDLIFEGWRADSPGDISLGFWIGEPYGVMKGYRFLASAHDVARFVCDLQSDGDTAPPAGRLP